MFDHLGIFVSDSEMSILFYEKCLAPLEIKVYQRQPQFGAAIFSGQEDFPFLWVGPAKGDYHGTALNPSIHRPIHIAFKAPSIEAVREFHRIGLECGGTDNGSPENCGGNYFAAYLLDPDGNNIEAGIRGINL